MGNISEALRSTILETTDAALRGLTAANSFDEEAVYGGQFGIHRTTCEDLIRSTARLRRSLREDSSAARSCYRLANNYPAEVGGVAHLSYVECAFEVQWIRLCALSRFWEDDQVVFAAEYADSGTEIPPPKNCSAGWDRIDCEESGGGDIQLHSLCLGQVNDRWVDTGARSIVLELAHAHLVKECQRVLSELPPVPSACFDALRIEDDLSSRLRRRSPKVRRVVELLGEQRSYQEIAARTGASATHIRNIASDFGFTKTSQR